MAPNEWYLIWVAGLLVDKMDRQASHGCRVMMIPTTSLNT